ncbi:hypothetical protein ACN27E_07280 [Mycobacterium sp. WMMD1722]|uniref:hypothetical protein n=1 Tax=Mycobacterium sp. WMMD1722 TaxID=3404117 RepID=UPI003BF4BB2C
MRLWWGISAEIPSSQGLPITDILAQSTFEPDERWIPVDRRWLGFDRRSIGPAVTVLALAFVMSIVLPNIDDFIGYDDEVAAGDVIGLDGGVTFVPEPGWGITSGVRIGSPQAGGGYPQSATVADGDVTLTVKVDNFDGDASALLDQVETTGGGVLDGDTTVMSERATVTSDSGDSGVVEEIGTLTTDGLLVAYVFDGVGVVAVALGPDDPSSDETDAVHRMITSIRGDKGAAA